MRTKAEKMQSTFYLKIVFAILISATPFLGALSESAGLFAVLSSLGALLSWRIYETKKIYMPKMGIITLIFFLYSLIASLWAKDNSGHFFYISALLSLVLFASLFVDYINKNNDGGLSRRIVYMISVSGFLSAVLNIFVWFTYYIPLGKPYSFFKGFNSSFGFGAFMLLSSGCIIYLLRKGSKRKKTLILMLIITLFSFIMAKSLGALLFVMALGASYIIRNKGKKTYFALAVGFMACFITAFVIKLLGNVAFRDAFVTGLTHPFGMGGGAFFKSYAVYASEFYQSAEIPLFALLASGSGILGIIYLALLVLYVAYGVFKNKNFTSILVCMITFYILFEPFRGELASVFMWLGLMLYNENAQNTQTSISINKNREQKIVIAILTVCVISLFALGATLIKNTADSLYEEEDYMGAYSWYKASSNVNFLDDESARRVSVCLRKLGRVSPDESEAIKYVDKAIARSGQNMANYIEKARVYEASERFDRAINQWETVITKAGHNDKYKLQYSKVLYKVIKNQEKGSSETKEAYEKLISISEKTNDLDIKKEINDIRDKAYDYTKGELKDEGEIES